MWFEGLNMREWGWRGGLKWFQGVNSTLEWISDDVLRWGEGTQVFLREERPEWMTRGGLNDRTIKMIDLSFWWVSSKISHGATPPCDLDHAFGNNQMHDQWYPSIYLWLIDRLINRRWIDGYQSWWISLRMISTTQTLTFQSGRCETFATPALNLNFSKRVLRNFCNARFKP